MKRIKLNEALTILNDLGYEVEWNENTTLNDFISYYERHYKRDLEKYAQTLEKCDSLRFLNEDLRSIFDLND